MEEIMKTDYLKPAMVIVSIQEKHHILSGSEGGRGVSATASGYDEDLEGGFSQGGSGVKKYNPTEEW
ncbi:MAG: hypothetical protein J6W52_09515 [Bacteroidaceae bacterium]|nr:hypothetical protein [Bacteroidaceae bacterium]